MIVVISDISKYILALIMVLYGFSCFNVFRFHTEADRKYIYFRQNIYMLLIYTISFGIMILRYREEKYLFFYCISLLVIISIIIFYKVFYKKSNRLLVNNMCMLLSVGFIILTRLSYDKAIRQFAIAVFSIAITLLIPFVISKGPFFSRFSMVYAIVGILSLLVVLLFSVTTFGAKINISVLGITFQPSEFVKIIFVFAMAGFFSKDRSIKGVIISSILASIHILILVLSKDLGGAVIFFVIYLSIMYVATGNIIYSVLGIFCGVIASKIGYQLFPHVRTRVLAFTDPLGTVTNAGYQISQSLFAIGTGGMFGMGIGGGAPKKIPVVTSDFVFSAICEEMGAFFGIGLILVCISCLVMFLNIAIRFGNLFYKYVAVGLAVLYGFQVFLTIGGVVKFIPLTGVTLPLISYGGTSILVSIVLFSIIQGLYISVRNGADFK